MFRTMLNTHGVNRMLIVATCLAGLIALPGVTARGEPISVVTGTYFEVELRSMHPVGSPTVGPDLWGFVVSINNISPENPDAAPNTFDGYDAEIVGDGGLVVTAGVEGRMHQQILAASADTITPYAGPYEFKYGTPPIFTGHAYVHPGPHPHGNPRTGIDSHFLFEKADVGQDPGQVLVIGPPEEDYDPGFAESGEPADGWQDPTEPNQWPWPIWGSYLNGVFADSGQTHKSWELAYVVAEEGSTFTFNALVANDAGEGEILTGEFPDIGGEPGEELTVDAGGPYVLDTRDFPPVYPPEAVDAFVQLAGSQQNGQGDLTWDWDIGDDGSWDLADAGPAPLVYESMLEALGWSQYNANHIPIRLRVTDSGSPVQVDEDLTELTYIPEPATLLLLGWIPVVGLALQIRRRRRSGR